MFVMFMMCHGEENATQEAIKTFKSNQCNPHNKLITKDHKKKMENGPHPIKRVLVVVSVTNSASASKNAGRTRFKAIFDV